MYGVPATNEGNDMQFRVDRSFDGKGLEIRHGSGFLLRLTWEEAGDLMSRILQLTLAHSLIESVESQQHVNDKQDSE